MTPTMKEALFEHLVEKPELYQNEMVVFLWDEFRVMISRFSIGRLLKTANWTKKVLRRIARERSAEVRADYLERISGLDHRKFIFVDESGCDKRIGSRRRGWSPRGITAAHVARHRRGNRYHVLPAYTVHGIIYSWVFQGTMNSARFEAFIAKLLCLREPGAVLVMNNASFHHSEQIRAMCTKAGVILLYLPPYSPDLNPIEEYSSDFKGFIKKNWQKWETNQEQGFTLFLQWCVDVVGAKKKNAQGHFRHSGLDI